ncbi:MAG: type VI secretion system protein TssA [Planctomycetaceae bacterium]|nr:type VI secretion system protein TssA [Planctomycetaceae bacterium]
MELELDTEAVLQPFDGDSRVGSDLRSDDNPNNAYRRIRDARNSARDRETRDDRGDERRSDEKLAIEHWSDVWFEGLEYLVSVAKDLEIVAYMIEASIRLDGISGFAESLNLTAELIESFWGEILPTPDEDGIETTLRPIARLNGDSITYPLQRVSITEDVSAGEFVVWQYDQARRIQKLLENNPEEAQEQISRGAITETQLTQAVTETSDGFYQTLNRDLTRASAALDRLNDTLDRLVEEEFVPNLSRFREGLDLVSSTIRELAGSRLDAAADVAADEEMHVESTSSAGGSAPAAPRPQSELATREDALKLLEKVAAWFARCEPQSILPHEIRKVIRRGRMSPEELYRDLIDDDSVRRQLFRDVGIVVQDDDGD